MAETPITSWTTSGKAWVNPKDSLDYSRRQGAPIREYPESLILCYQKNPIDLAANWFNAQRVESTLSSNVRADCEFMCHGKRISIVRSGYGAPMAALVLEDLIARGVRKVINVGTAGSLQHEGVNPGDLVLCTKAVRNEGTSYHYLRPSKYAYPDRQLLRELECTLKKEGYPYHKGPTITIDAPYRFTVKEAARLRREGVLTSEMESAAVFAVSRFRKTSAAALFVISDTATEDFQWNPQFHSKELAEGFEGIFKACTETLAR